MSELNEIVADRTYEFGFHDDVEPVFSTQQGLTAEVVRQISREKGEPIWMLNYRLKAFHIYEKLPMPQYGPDLSGLDLAHLKYYQKMTDQAYNNWEDVPATVRETFDKIGIPEAERQHLSGSAVQYESEVVYHHMREKFAAAGIIFTDIDTALKKYPKLFRKWFGKLVKPTNNKFAALNAAVWSGGSFIYVPKGVTLTTPLQSYYRMNTAGSGQFERTLIIVAEGAHIEYVEGCSASIYSQDNLHAAVVEVNVLPNAYCRYTTIQNWSNNVYSLETKRAQALENATMEWVDGNFGSKVTMKYPSVYLNGEGAHGTMLSIAVAGHNVDSDTGGQMIHNAKRTTSSIVSKSVSKAGGAVDYRGKVRFGRQADGSFAHVECDTIIMDTASSGDTVPLNEILNGNVSLEHEAKVSKISEEQLYYLMSRGISEAQATEMIVMGFVEPFTKELPLEYAIELNRMIGYEMTGSVG